MSDTRQEVLWAIERACPLREGNDWTCPRQAAENLSSLTSCAAAMKSGSVVDGIWVTSQRWLGINRTGDELRIPISGISVEHVAEEFGGWEEVRNACGDCEANVFSNAPSSIAGCYGRLDVVSPGSEELERLLWRMVRRHNLEARLRRCFHVTKPLWFGFWLDSPLDVGQCELLSNLLPKCLPRLWGEDENGEPVDPVYDMHQFASSSFNPAQYYGQYFEAFFRALRTSVDNRLPLHVWVTPPGHADLGWYTRYPHCPRCKAGVGILQGTDWMRCPSYECEVCENTFCPAETTFSEPIEYDPDRNSLKDRLGERYDAFFMRFAEANGWTESDILAAMDDCRNGPLRRRIQRVRNRMDSIQRKHEDDLSTDHGESLRASVVLELASGVEIELVRIMPGEFLMGSDENEQEQPVRHVQILLPFYIGKYPLTQWQWDAVMSRNPSRFYSKVGLPVEQVSWFHAQVFCIKLSEMLGRPVRLPTEAEWEYACRAGTTTRYSRGNVIGPADANFCVDAPSSDKLGRSSSVASVTTRRTTPVDQFPPNPWGVFDMHGNVREWCQDSWHADYNGAPNDGRPWTIDQGLEFVARGGGADSSRVDCRSASRFRKAAFGRDTEPPKDPMEFDGTCDIPAPGDTLLFHGLRIVCSPTKEDLA